MNQQYNRRKILILEKLVNCNAICSVPMHLLKTAMVLWLPIPIASYIFYCYFHTKITNNGLDFDRVIRNIMRPVYLNEEQ